MLLAGAFISLLPSCKKYINLAPKDSTYDQVFWTNGSNAQNALSGAYGLLRKGFQSDRSYFVFGDLPSNAFWLDGGKYWNYQSLLYANRFEYSYAPYLESSLQDWTRFYTVINQCHLIIENVPNIDESKFERGKKEKNEIIGEGHFLRAFTYFYITKVWSDPVLTTESLKDPTNVAPRPRTPENEVLDYCITDLKIAASILPFYNESGKEKVHADKGAAWSILANVYAWKHDYTNALLYCDSIINSGRYRLEPINDYLNIWKGGSVESIFELNMLFDKVNNEATDYFFGEFLRDPIIPGRDFGWEINADLMDYELFTDPSVDQRYQNIIQDATDVRILNKYANVNYYDPNNEDVFVVSNNLVIERLADIYLLKAEALNELGNTSEALLALNIIKQRAGLEDYEASQEDTKYEIVEEFRREMIGEGRVVFDMIRNNSLLYFFGDVYTQERVDKTGYYWPLDMRTLLPQDPLLTQNPWWINH